MHIACGQGAGGEDIRAAGFPFHRLPVTRTPFAPWRDANGQTVSVLLTNIAILLPSAYWAAIRPSWAVHIASGVLTLLVGVALLVG